MMRWGLCLALLSAATALPTAPQHALAGRRAGYEAGFAALPRIHQGPHAALPGRRARTQATTPVQRLRGGAQFTATQVAFMRVAPTLACLIGNSMCLAPMRKVLEVRRTGQLGELNSLVYTALVANNFGWLLYGFAAKDPYILLTSVTQLSLALFYTISCHPYSPPAEKAKNFWLAQAYTVTFAAALLTVFAVGGSSKFIIGLVANGVLVSYYSMPLAVLAKVVRQKSSESIDPLLTAIGFFHAALWTIYGYGVNDIMLLISNASSTVMQIAFLMLYVIYRKGPKRDLKGTSVSALKRSAKGNKNLDVGGGRGGGAAPPPA